MSGDGGGGGDSSGYGGPGDSGGGKGGGGSSGGTTGFTPTGAGVTAQTGTDISIAQPTVPNAVGVSGSFGGDSGSGGAGTGTGLPGISTSPTTSLTGPTGITAAPAASSGIALAPPVGQGTSPTDFSSNYDPFSGGTAAGGAAPASTALTPQQLGQPAIVPSSPANATAGTPSTGGSKSVLDSLGIKNPLGAAIGAGGLGYEILQGQKAQKFTPELEAQAASLNAQGQQLLSYLNSGSLPPGLKASLDQATSSAKAKIISNFAAQGLNTDPTQNTALASQLAQVDQQALISTAQIGQQLLSSGVQETGISSDLYKTLANIDQTQTAAIGKAIAGFASSLSGSGSGLNLKLSG